MGFISVGTFLFPCQRNRAETQAEVSSPPINPNTTPESIDKVSTVGFPSSCAGSLGDGDGAVRDCTFKVHIGASDAGHSSRPECFRTIHAESDRSDDIPKQATDERLQGHVFLAERMHAQHEISGRPLARDSAPGESWPAQRPHEMLSHVRLKLMWSGSEEPARGGEVDGNGIDHLAIINHHLIAHRHHVTPHQDCHWTAFSRRVMWHQRRRQEEGGDSGNIRKGRSAPHPHTLNASR